MKLLEQTIEKIAPLNDLTMARLKKNSRAFFGSDKKFGYLEDILVQYAGITNETVPTVPKKCMVVACADHGVAEEGVSAYPVETTVQMTKNYLIAKGAGANAMANHCGADLIVVDVGIAAPMEPIEGLINRKIQYGTKNFTKGPAMSRQEAQQALEVGIEIAVQKVKEGYRSFCLGEMGIANTTSSAAIVAAFAQLSPEEATGRGTNISDDKLKIKIETVRKGLVLNQPNPKDGIDVLAKVGGFELGCLAGVILGAAAGRAAIVIDGFNAAAAALIAASLCPHTRRYLIASHLSLEPAHSRALELLKLKAYMNMGFRFGEATGAALAMNMFDALIKSYAGSQTAPITHLLPDPVKPGELPDRFVAEELDKQAIDDCQHYIDNLTKPLGSLGALEELTVQLAGILGDKKPNHLKKSILLFHQPKNKAIYAFAGHAGAEIIITDTESDKITAGHALAIGMQAADTAFAHGSRIIGLGESDAFQSIAGQNQSFSSFANISNAELAALTGAIIAAASNRCAVVLDGSLTATAASIAIGIAPQIKPFLINANLSAEPLHKNLLAELGIPYFLNMNFSLGGGCAAALGLTLLNAGLHMLNDMKTFKQAAVAIASDGPGAKKQNLDI